MPSSDPFPPVLRVPACVRRKGRSVCSWTRQWACGSCCFRMSVRGRSSTSGAASCKNTTTAPSPRTRGRNSWTSQRYACCRCQNSYSRTFMFIGLFQLFGIHLNAATNMWLCCKAATPGAPPQLNICICFMTILLQTPIVCLFFQEREMYPGVKTVFIHEGIVALHVW